MSSVSAPTTPMSPTDPGVAAFHSVVLSYRPRLDGEIALHAGDLVTSVRDLGNGWSLGRNVSRGGGNSVGIFPTKCLLRHGRDTDPRRSSEVGFNDDGRRQQRRGSSGGTVGGERRRRRSGNGGLSSFGRKTQKSQRSFELDAEIRYCSPDVGIVFTGEAAAEAALSGDANVETTVPEKFANEWSGCCSECGIIRPTQSVELRVEGQSAVRRERWVKKPRMIVKPSLDKSFADPDHRTPVSPTDGERVVLERFRDPSTTAECCRGSRLAFPATATLPLKSRSVAPPTELPLNLPPNRSRSTRQSGSGSQPILSPTLHGLWKQGIYHDKGEDLRMAHGRSAVEKNADQKDSIPLETAPPRSSRSCSCSFALKPLPTSTSDLTSRPYYENSYYYTETCPENRCFRLAGSVSFGPAVGIVVFLWMLFHLDYAFVVAASTGGALAFLLSLFLVLSRVCRCVAAILLPSVCTARGRLSFVLVISGLLLSGPVTNVYVSVQEVSRSMGCSAEQSYGQMMLFLKPFDSMMAQLNGTIGRLQEAAKNVSVGLKPLDDGLSSVEMDLHNGKLQLFGTKRVTF